MDKVRVHLVALMVAVFFAVPSLDWYSGLGVPLQAPLHHFLHANIFHLAVNCLAVWTMFNRRWKEEVKELLCAFVIGTAAYMAASAHSVGMSDVLFAVLGLRAARQGWWKSFYFAVMWGTILLTAFLPNISGLTHAISCAAGTAVGLAASSFRKLLDDYGKARGNS